MATISIAGYVGLVVRGKISHSHHPGNLDQHADCILSNGAPIGFYGTGGGSSGSIGMGMSGVVYDYGALLVHRPYYVDAALATRYGVRSTILLVKVNGVEAAAFDAAWASMRASPGGFNIVGNNCSTHASNAFMAAGILSSGIPGLDTPDHLYDQLYALPRATPVYSGFVGFTSSGSGYIVTV